MSSDLPPLGEGGAPALYERVQAHPSATARLLSDRSPERVRVWCGPTVPDGITDLIRAYEADVLDPAVEQGGLQFDLVAHESYHDMGEKPVSKWGNTNAVSLSNNVLDKANMALGDTVSIHVRDGEIHLSRPRQ